MDQWEQLRQQCMSCRACGLADTRTNVVFGVGDPRADAESHMEVLQAMSELFESKESTQRVLDASNEKEIYDLFVGAV